MATWELTDYNSAAQFTIDGQGCPKGFITADEQLSKAIVICPCKTDLGMVRTKEHLGFRIPYTRKIKLNITDDKLLR